MYKKNSNSLIKHIDFIMIDIILFCFSFWLSYVVRHNDFNMLDNSLYTSYCLIIILSVFAGVLLRSYKGIIYRGYGIELRKTISHATFVFAGVIFLSFIQKETSDLSRITCLLFYFFSFVFVYSGRILWKNHVVKRLHNSNNREVLIVSDVKSADNVIQKFYNRGVYAFKIKGVAILQDEDFAGNKNTQILKKIQGVDIVACNREGVFEYIEQNVVDEIIFSGHCDCDEFKSLIVECEMIGLTVHIVIDQIDSLIGETAVENMAGVPMLSSTIRMVSCSDLLLKRLLDIVGSILGLIITGISFIFVAPAIYISDPGPIFFAQERIGKNGRRFKIYKYRSMYKDAEKRKAELMYKNEMQGLMFKMENDPRIIGSGKDGTKKGVGDDYIIGTIPVRPHKQWFSCGGNISIVLSSCCNYNEIKEKHQLSIPNLNPILIEIVKVSTYMLRKYLRLARSICNKYQMLSKDIFGLFNDAQYTKYFDNGVSPLLI